MQIRKSEPRKARRKGRSRKGEGSLRLRGKTYWYIIPNLVPGEPRIEGTCATGDYQEALRAKARALLARDPRARALRPTTVDEVMDEYARYCENEKKRSWRSLKTAIKHLRKAFGPLVCDGLTTLDTDQFRDDRMAEDGVGDSTVNRELGYLRAALRREMEVTPPRVTRIPYMRTPSEKDHVREGFIDRADYAKILPELPEALRAIFVCAFHTGARSGELKLITWRQVNWEQNIIELRPKTTKNSDGRWIPIWGDMREHLERQKSVRDAQCPECPWVFFWPRGYHARSVPGDRLHDFRFAWGDACARAGFPDLLFHDLRRSAIKFADQEAGISPRLVRLMSGHKTESVYNRYNIGDGRDVAKMGERLDSHIGRTRG